MQATGLLRGHNKPYTLNYNRVASKANRIVKVVMRNHKRKIVDMERRRGRRREGGMVATLGVTRSWKGSHFGKIQSPLHPYLDNILGFLSPLTS